MDLLRISVIFAEKIFSNHQKMDSLLVMCSVPQKIYLFHLLILQHKCIHEHLCSLFTPEKFIFAS